MTDKHKDRSRAIPKPGDDSSRQGEALRAQVGPEPGRDRRRVSSFVIVATIAIVVVFLITQTLASRDPTSGAEGRILVSLLTDSRTESDFELVMVRPDGGRRELTFGGEHLDSSFALSPAVSSDGALAFIEDGTLYTADLVGGPARLILDASYVAGVAWSPDGTMLAANAWQERGGRSGLFVINADGSGRRLIHQEGGYHATWSPDGTQIAFDAPTDGDDEFWDIFRIDIDGSDLVNLTNTPDKAETTPSWSWTNDRIAYEGWSHESETSVSTIRTMGADGTDVQTLTTTGRAVSPSWSQDGTSVYFIKHDRRNRSAPILAMVRADGTEETNLVTFDLYESPYSAVLVP